jgi:Tfp pilus assembly protein FimT
MNKFQVPDLQLITRAIATARTQAVARHAHDVDLAKQRRDPTYMRDGYWKEKMFVDDLIEQNRNAAYEVFVST